MTGAQLSAARIRVYGIVQGVGFRPFVHCLAGEHGLNGSVLNFAGGVEILLEGAPEAIDAFVTDLRVKAPPIAVIDEVAVERRTPTGLSGFHIVKSEDVQRGAILISPDVATCPDCERELLDPGDRRYLHPFINCTNCGPRFTIVKAAPYDRPRTSMGAFEMCPRCRAEYEDITNRRYHAQPNACHECGPALAFEGPHHSARGYEAIVAAAQALCRGQVVAIKGLGGFHLACNARDEAAVARLRRRKRRQGKAFAIMVDSLHTVRRICESSSTAEKLLSGPRRPIVLLPEKATSRIASQVAPDTYCLGVMLPYAPVHHLVFRESGLDALVMTSGNLSEEPLCTDNAEARQRLSGIADAFLDHDREIVVPCDDSVVRPTRDLGGEPGPTILMRRARGYVPFPIRLAWPTRARVLAVGAHLKNTFCVTDEDRAFVSQHIGDLDDAKTLQHFEWALDHLCSVLRIQPQAIACDLHPDYLSSQIAERLSREHGWPRLTVQHHHAHIASCMAEHGLQGPVIGVACDGLGYGDDGTVWGCEILIADAWDYRRAGHLRSLPLPGGEAAVREPRRVAAAYLTRIFGDDFAQELRLPLCTRLASEEVAVWQQMCRGGINAPLASSAGRLFDAVAAILDLGDRAEYEGQPPMKLEAAAYQAAPAGDYPYAIIEKGGCVILDADPTVRRVVEDWQAGMGVGSIAASFQEAFVNMLADGVARVAEQSGLRQVVLSGGTFQNEAVLLGLLQRLREKKFQAYPHRDIPCNDGGLSLGQAIVASARYE